MSKAGATKTHRLFSSPNQKRADPIIAFPTHTEPCCVCEQPMVVAEGQHMKYHAACRKRVRSLRKQGKRIV